jgi:hypothetical protein
MSFSLIVKYGKEKQNMKEMSTNFPKFWKIIQSGTFVISGGCCLWNVFSEPLCVGVSGQESSKRVREDDGVQMFVR